MSPLELQSQIESKNGPLERVLRFLPCGPADGLLDKLSVGSASLQPSAAFQSEPRVPLPGLNVGPRAEGCQPSHSPV